MHETHLAFICHCAIYYQRRGGVRDALLPRESSRRLGGLPETEDELRLRRGGGEGERESFVVRPRRGGVTERDIDLE